ncbi:hypothetical protein MLD38_039913 [Melastoma candidum]|uniref:Uncharacterized protein n=1 Tax=Melastoma candidum TaxID=119954 RepID=A0ACB9L5Y1_9MYRT|nr:hypothetical protein MLD38_039913 [Melastoma candidum]
MASSNRHWPSMFRSKPCNSQHQWQHDINSSILPSGCHRTPCSSPGCEERTPEPKPRWNPKPEQIRILEAIFDSGMVNPPRDEIRKIRAQLQEYGQVGDANVFYWFQNRKSRSKHKLRHLQNSKQQKQQNANNSGKGGQASVTSPPPVAIPTHSTLLSSSPSEKSSSSMTTQLSNETTTLSLGSIINQVDYFPISTSATGVHEDQFLAEMPLLFPTHQGFCFSSAPQSAPAVSEQSGMVVGPCSNLLLSELLGHDKGQGGDSGKMTTLLGYHSLIGGNIGDVDSHSHPAATSVAVGNGTSTTAATTVPPALSLPPHNNHVQGVPGSVDLAGLGVGGGSKSIVFINDVAFQVSPGPFNVRETFGDEAVLINSAGQLVVTDQWGITLQSLQHGASYYLI